MGRDKIARLLADLANELLRRDRAQGSCRTSASVVVQSAPVLSPSWPPLPGDYTVLDKDAPGAACTLADEDLYEALRRGLPSRLDHAAYLGFELGKAERALKLKTRHVQDRPELQENGSSE